MKREEGVLAGEQGQKCSSACPLRRREFWHVPEEGEGVRHVCDMEGEHKNTSLRETLNDNRSLGKLRQTSTERKPKNSETRR
mmetsp:Transcript_89483/g.186949  ORF Transcript_89483/g.186949 Transcript_89483/m.186949 type:complete len:82 (+) Transcript_89483:20-265(+)